MTEQDRKAPNKTDDPWKTVTAKNWKHFIEIIEDNTGDSNSFVFRGQSNSCWTLEHSLRRQELKGFDEIKDGEKAAFKVFHAHAHKFIDSNLYLHLHNHGYIYMWWSMMQHYGVPTRLLDWTLSPYVAAYFACESGSGDGVVWAVNRHEIEREMRQTEGYNEYRAFMESKDSIRDSKIKDSYLYNEETLPYITFIHMGISHERLTSQNGLFSVSNQADIDHAEAIINITKTIQPNFNRPLAMKIVIPNPIHIFLKQQFMVKLQQMNITGATLFPGLDGIGRYCKDMFRHRLTIPF